MYRRRTSGASALPRLFLSLLLITLGAPAVVVATASPANADLAYVMDEGGANDFPGQKDLTRHGVDYANAAAGSIQVEFNWDEIAWTGNDTGDGCILFDTDGDLMANYAVCVSAEGAPAVQLAGSPTVYECGDDRADRCSQPVDAVDPLSAGSVTECFVTQTASDPFASGAASPLDTTATCTIDLDDVGVTGSTVLINTCSYPSGQPNSAPSDCVLVPRDGTLRIVKNATPIDGTFSFNLKDNASSDAPTGIGSISTVDGTGSLNYPVTSTLTFTLAEVTPLPPGWSLESASCDNGETLTSLDVDPDQTVTCTFNNEYDLAPTATLTKTANPTTMAEPGGPVTWTVQIDNTSPEGESIYLTQLVDTMFGGGAGFGDLLDWDDADNSCFRSEADDSIEIPYGGTSDPDFSCTFTADISPRAPGANHRNVVTATLNDGEGNTINPSDDALVTITDVLPTIDVTKTASPDNVLETGGQVTYTVTVANTSGAEDLTLSTLNDNVFGNLRTTNAAITNNTCDDLTTVTLLKSGVAYSCSFQAQLSGNVDTPHRNIVRALAIDNEGNEARGSDDAVVTFGDVPPTITTLKVANPTSLNEPGGTVTYSVTVTNTSAENVTLTSLTDTLVNDSLPDSAGFGDLLDPANPNVITNTCDDPGTSRVLAANNGQFTCQFSATVSGEGGDVHVNRVTAVVIDDDGSPDTESDTATVSIIDVLPDITVTKSADPTSVPEPGGTVTYTVRVTNNGTVESLTLRSLWDDKFGDSEIDGGLLSWDADGNTCDEMSTTIAAGGFVECTFTAEVNGNAGDQHINTVTGTAADNDGNPDTDEDSATVNITDVAPVIEVTKSANPTSVPETGGTVTYTVDVENKSAETVTLTVLDDDEFGDLLDTENALISDSDCAAGSTILAGTTYTCTFDAVIDGLDAGDQHVNIVTGTAVDDDGTPDTDTGTATVDITDVAPTVQVDKTPSPATVPETGGEVTYTVDITNTSDEDVWLRTLIDDMFGDLLNPDNTDINTTDCNADQLIEPDDTYTCTFTADLDLNAGQTHTNVVTGTVEDNEDTPATDTGTATVTGTDVAPVIEVTKSANPTSVPETGGTVTYTVDVENKSAETVTLTVLDDDEFGDLLDTENALISDSDCAAGSTILAGTTYTCTFDAVIDGLDAGDQHVNIVTGTAVDDDGTPDTDTGTATVDITDVAPTVQVDKTPSPATVPETGGEVTYTVDITNTSDEDVWLRTLIDDMFGDLLNPDNTDINTTDCNADQLIEPDDTYTCTFTADLDLNAGQTHTNVVTGTVEDNEDTPATDTGTATVTGTDVAPVIEVTKSANPTSVPETGGTVTYTVDVENKSAETVTLTVLDDDEFGDLLDTENALISDSDCAAGSTILAGTTYTCTFDAVIDGLDAGDQHVNIVTGTAVDDDGTPDTDTGTATVDITDVAPTVQVDKTPSPATVPETGGEVTYTVDITNTSDEDVWLRTLIDDMFGDLLNPDNTDINTTDCNADQLIEPDDTYTCTFTADLDLNAGQTHTNVVTGTVEDNEDTPATDTGTATVTGTDVAPVITVVKTADVETVPETGGPVIYTVDVKNESAETVRLTDLDDDKFGDLLDPENPLISASTCADDAQILAGATYTCAFQASVGGQPGSHVNLVVAVVVDDDGSTATEDDDATVRITDVAPTINLNKSGISSINEPGGVITYGVSVQNTSFEPVTLTSLVDDKFGDLFDDAGNALISGSTCVDNSTIGIGGTYSCTFNASVTGNAGFSHTNVVTGTVIDDDQTPVTDSDDHTVTIANVLPGIDVTKAANVASVPESGRVVTYTVTVRNTSSETVILRTLFDDKFGDLFDDPGNSLINRATCVDNTSISAGGTYSCTFDATVAGVPGVAHVNVVTGIAFDDDGSSATDTGAATVAITDVPPTVDLTKSAELASVPEPGAVVAFTVEISNTSFETVTLTSLVDDLYGDLLDPDNELVDANTCVSGPIQPGATYSCSFAAFVFGDGGEDHRNVITGTVTDNDGTTGRDDDDEVIGIADVAPTVEMTKTADVDEVDAPGGVVVYTVTIENTSVEQVTLTDLVDDKFGDLLDDAGNALISASTCVDDVVIGIGETYTCSFSATVSGVGGIHVNVVTGTLVDNEGNEVEGVAEESVDINEVAGVEEERPPAEPPAIPRPPAILPDTGADGGLAELLGLGALMMLLGTWVLLQGRRREG